jgi:GNAT superfamily N-acetyltransferase
MRPLAGADRAGAPQALKPVLLDDGPAVEGAIFEFQKLAWPHRRIDWILPRWRWMFVESARRLGVGPKVWICRDGDRIVGHNGAIPVRLKIGPDERLAAWLVDTMVLEEYRGLALGSRLMVEAHAELPLALSLGQTEQMRQIQFQLGWAEVAPLRTAQLLIRPERVLKGKLPAPLAQAAGWGLRASDAARGLWRPGRRVEVRPVDRFGVQHDRLWEAMARDVGCAVVRNASYLNWKYVDQPGQEFLKLELADADVVLGVVILMFRKADAHYRYDRAFLVDIVAPLSDDWLLLALVWAAREQASQRGADALVCYYTDRRLARALRKAGFLARDPERFLLVRADPPDPDHRRRLLSPDAWFVTQGDSDIDRPW